MMPDAADPWPSADAKARLRAHVARPFRRALQRIRSRGECRAMTLPLVPASWFGIVLGIAGLAGTWRAAHAAWGLPAIVSEVLTLAAAVAWMAIAALYAAKWARAREAAIAELYHPVQCCFVGLAGVATMLVATGVLPYAPDLASVLFGCGAAFVLGFALWRTGLLWRGGRDPAATTPVLYLPAVAGSFVAAAGAATLGHRDWAQLAFGAGLLSWLAVESVLLHRLYTGAELPPPLRPTLGIQLAPPAVGVVAYLGANGGVPDLFAHALVGYGLLQALILMRLLPWILEEPFAPSYWAFTFGATALATAPIRMVEQGGVGAVALLAPWLFAAANAAVAVIAAASLGRLLGGIPPTRLMRIAR